jgi:hypothetical protein
VIVSEHIRIHAGMLYLRLYDLLQQAFQACVGEVGCRSLTSPFWTISAAVIFPAHCLIPPAMAQIKVFSPVFIYFF